MRAWRRGGRFAPAARRPRAWVASAARRPGAWVALAAVPLVIVGVRLATPARYPAIDGTLVVTAQVGTDGGTVEAVATWAAGGPVPPARRTCTNVVLALPPHGARSPQSDGAAPTPTSAEPVRRVLDQYGDVLPPDLPQRAQAWLAPGASGRGALTVRWDGATSASPRVWVAAVCPEAVHGFVELRR